VREELLGIRRDWLAGKLQASGRGLAAAIVANCRERGIAVIGTAGVREWLTRVR
jgi:predicted ThiF/HesA family dinucleotide-utilizing enzyme